MTTFVIGDIQGCFQELEDLLLLCEYDRTKDELWLVGDLINRGPDNAGVLDLLIELPNVKAVLGNHDLHFLAVALIGKEMFRGDTLDDLLKSRRRDLYIDYIRNLPFLHFEKTINHIMVHAGIPPQLDIPAALDLAKEVEEILRSDSSAGFLKSMYGNEPNGWMKPMRQNDRLRLIANSFTRLRYCTGKGDLEMTHKTEVVPNGFKAWYNFERSDQVKILFGHWAAINGRTGKDWAIALDTGCIWGQKLTAYNLDKKCFISVPARERK
jgi:bis(5'-nucleosyl)-tetraphosphatase (symmetrical)